MLRSATGPATSILSIMIENDAANLRICLPVFNLGHVKGMTSHDHTATIDSTTATDIWCV